MKRIILVMMVAMLCGISESVAQNSGLGFNYQAVVRKADGVLLSHADVTLRISLYPGQSATSATWVEEHRVKTDYSGSFGITVGKGIRATNSVASKFSDINFAAVYYWMKIEIKESGTYHEISFAALPSTPYSEVASNALPTAGIIVPFAGAVNKIPAGWLLCDGAAISRSEYANLYNAIGVCWGVGDGSTTFNLPDLRGMFLRGVSGNSGNDADADSRGMLNENGGNTGNNVGSYQGDAIRNITGQFAGVENGAYSLGAFYTIAGGYRGSGKLDNDNPVIDFNASRVVPVGSDNRPKNVYVNYIIKY